MSNDDLTPPSEPPRDIPGLPNDPVDGAESEPTQVFPTVPPPPSAVPPPESEPVLDPTPPGVVVPPATVPAATVPTDPATPVGLGEPVDQYELPWYRQPGQLALLLFALLAIGGLIVLLIVLTGGDDDPDGAVVTTETPVAVVVTRVDALGDPVVTSITAVVTANEPTPSDYVWVVPAEALVGDPATRLTDAGGRTEFRWRPADTSDVATWSSTVELGEVVSSDIASGGLSAECEVDRGPDVAPAGLVVEVAIANDQADPAEPRIASYSFPNVEFRAGDRVTCTIANNAVPIGTTTTTTTIPSDTTTTVVDTTTTVVDTTTTLAPTTTVAPTVPPTPAPTVPPTPAPTTSTTTTLPSPVVTPGSALELLVSRSDLSGFVDIIQQAGLVDEFNDPDRRMTVFAPDNDAVTELIQNPDGTDLSDPAELRDLVRTHVLDGEAISEDQIVQRPSIDVQFGGPQEVDPGPPVRVGGARLIDADNQVTEGIVHVIDTVLTPAP